MFDLCHTAIPGCYEIYPRVFDDKRGRFVKIFHKEIFSSRGLNVDFSEEYYSASKYGVVRGMHFQRPPMEHVKVVYCVHGEVFDVVVDLRLDSPTYGQTAIFNLNAEKGNYLYIPSGLAHGFCTMSETAILIYKVSTVYSPSHDDGILWNSLGINWPLDSPVLSDRDRNFIPLSEFKSPFVYE